MLGIRARGNLTQSVRGRSPRPYYYFFPFEHPEALTTGRVSERRPF